MSHRKTDLGILRSLKSAKVVLEADIDEALVRTFGGNTLDYDRYKPAAEFYWGPLNLNYETPLYAVHEALEKIQARQYRYS